MNENSTASTLRRHEKYDRLIAAAKKLKPIATAVAHPCDETSLKGALEAGEAGFRTALENTAGGVGHGRGVESLQFGDKAPHGATFVSRGFSPNRVDDRG